MNLDLNLSRYSVDKKKSPYYDFNIFLGLLPMQFFQCYTQSRGVHKFAHPKEKKKKAGLIWTALSLHRDSGSSVVTTLDY